tara:strand:+ start:3153 stop:4439 length:1287 start_codon:yes stop_codon:yes gene_type:complete
MRYLFLFLLIACSSSCSNENGELTLQIGEDYVASNTKVYFIDTLTVKASTFQFDSLIVSNSKRLLIGHYNDEIFGEIQSKSYIQLTNTTYDIEDEAVYDSISLILNYDNYFYNDTIPTQQYKVYELIEDIKSDDGSYYNTTNFSYNNAPIAVKDFLPRPKENDSLEIKVSDIYGATLFSKIKGNEINNIDEFLDDYKGLVIEANNDLNTSILGFSKNSVLRMYYTIDDETNPVEGIIDFAFNSSNTFNQTISDKTGTYFETIINQETILPSSETDNSSFIQAGTGIVTRIDIPYINSLNDISGEGVVIDAKLKFTLKNPYSNNLKTRDSLLGYIVDRKSNVLANLTYDGTTAIMSTIINDNPEFETDAYEIDIKTFIDIKQLETNEKYYLVIYPQDVTNSLDRYIFNGDQTADNLRMKLELTYAIYDE